ncbi:MAG: hypothetical protein JW860_07930 [Sedimentisphaerales bacterium]|nr:hypothetical protein [Sedimentisphaerales bacterium]
MRQITYFLVILMWGTQALAVDRLVPGEYLTIQEGIDAAEEGDTIIVEPGHYHENISFHGINIILTSTNPDDDYTIMNTVIQGNQTGSVVTFSGSEGSACRLNGFTITGGGHSSQGGGIAGNGTEAAISRCIVKNNSSSWIGGGIHNVDGLISQCQVSNNHNAVYGGGLQGCDGRISRCVISGNRAAFGGGGLAGCHGQIENCLISKNIAGGSGGALFNCDGDIINCTVALNNAGHTDPAQNGGGLYACDGLIINCIIWENNISQLSNCSLPVYCCIEDGGGGTGCISSDPHFALGEDFHLTAGSECIDAGNNNALSLDMTADLEGSPRFHEDPNTPNTGQLDNPPRPLVDMGAYEYHSDMPCLAVGPRPIVFNALENSPLMTIRDLAIRNSGPGIIQWEVSQSCPWLEIISSPTGEAADEVDYVSLQVDATGLTMGCYECSLRVCDPCALNNPLFVPVRMYVDQANQRHVPQVYPTIQKAIDYALEGNIVTVSPATYNEHIDFSGKDITVTGIDPEDDDVVGHTIINGGGTGSVVTFANGESPAAVLTGFTIIGGKGTYENMGDYSYYWGGGIYCWASPTIKNNVIRDNVMSMNWEQGIYSYGGGIFGYAFDTVIERNRIMANQAVIAGGILFFGGGEAQIKNNLIYSNMSELGGGVYLSGEIRLTNNTITSNHAGNVLVDNEPDVFDNIIIRAASGGGIGMIDSELPNNNIAYNNVWGNIGGNFVDIPDQTGLHGNISDNPLFEDEESLNFHLQPDSPCINSGDPAFIPAPDEKDFYGDDRLIGPLVDMGAVEYAGNLRPVADAGDDQTTTDLPGLITLDGSGSYDPLAEMLYYRWTQVQGPEVELSDPNAAITTFVPHEYGAYVFELVVDDGDLESFPDRVHIVLGSNHLPVADAGLSRYAGVDPLKLYGGRSYDPDNSGALSYQWRQVSGPPLNITAADSHDPTIGGFIQTQEIQSCEFELVVSDGEYLSLPDIVEVKIVPEFNESVMRFESGDFDPFKPTVIFFGGGDCMVGGPGTNPWDRPAWHNVANVISFYYYVYDGYPVSPGQLTYFQCGDMIIAYLSKVAPRYKQQIQTVGFSTGGQPAIDAARHINRTYADKRYMINQVSFTDGCCRDYLSSVNDYLSLKIDGERCFVDNYPAMCDNRIPGVLNATTYYYIPGNSHESPYTYYRDSIASNFLNNFNNGVAGGAFWSAVGPGKTLEMAPSAEIIYFFNWSYTSSKYNFYNESLYPGRFPEPVRLIKPGSDSPPGEPVLLTCQPSMNAVGYQLLVGPDPEHLDYVLSDTALPPAAEISEFPEGSLFWTIKARDAWGSTIYADPLRLPGPVTVTVPDDVPLIQDAIDITGEGDTIIIKPRTYYENIHLYGKNLRITSIDPDDSEVVANTVIQGDGSRSVITFSGTENSTCELAGFTITAGGNTRYGGGIAGNGTGAGIRQCIITNNSSSVGGGGIHNVDGLISQCQVSNNHNALYGGGLQHCDGRIERCVISDNTAITGGGGLSGCHGRIENCLIIENTAADSGGGILNCDGDIVNCTVAQNTAGHADPAQNGGGLHSCDGTITNCIIRDNSETQIVNCTLPHYSCFPGGIVEDNNMDTDPLWVNPAGSDFHLLPDSPAIDAGDPGNEWENEPWPNGGRINLGAYGNTSDAARSRDGLVFAGYGIVNKTRVGRVLYEYELALQVQNQNDYDVTDVQAQLVDATESVISVTDNSLGFALIGAGQTSVSDDTFRLVIDRSQLIEPGHLSWELMYYSIAGQQADQSMTMSLSIGDLDYDTSTSDLTREGIVNLQDFNLLAGYWLQIAPAANIAGNDIIDIEDLAVLASNWLEGTKK